MYRPRWIGDRLRASLEVAPVTVLTGARQTGKSTLLANEPPFNAWPRVTLDDLDALGQARSGQPEALWAGQKSIVIDEAQRAPELLSAIKRQIDVDRFGVRFTLSGSANLLLMSQISETLAGRATYHRLGPFALGESLGHPAPAILADLLDGRLPDTGAVPATDPFPLIQRGMMPATTGFSAEESVRWWEGYTATYLERDLRQLSQVESLPDFRRLMQAVALRSGGFFSQSDLGREIGVSQASVHRHLNLLEASHLLERVPGYAVSKTTRLRKRPKAYFFDSGAAAFLAGLFDVEQVRSAREAGGLFEGFVAQHLRVLADLLSPAAGLLYWRTAGGSEVDFVIEHGRRLLPIDVKLTSRPGFDDTKGLTAFLGRYPEMPLGVLVHTGSEVRRLGERVVAVPWSVIAGA